MATTDPSIELTFTLKRSTWDFLLTHLEDASIRCEERGDPQERNIEVWNTANTVRSALQTVLPQPVEPDWLTL